MVGRCGGESTTWIFERSVLKDSASISLNVPERYATKAEIKKMKDISVSAFINFESFIVFNFLLLI
jgi:hypothetical protein